MAPFVISEDTALTTEQAWGRITDWVAHARFVPFTRIEVTTSPPNGLHTVFIARTGIGRVGFDDPMEIVEWAPPVDGGPGRCRLEKRGRAVLGWAELSVDPRTGGSRATWREEARPATLPRLTGGASAAAGRLLFRRVLRKLLAA